MLRLGDIYTVYSLETRSIQAYILYIVDLSHSAYIYIALQIFHIYIWKN